MAKIGQTIALQIGWRKIGHKAWTKVDLELLQDEIGEQNI